MGNKSFEWDAGTARFNEVDEPIVWGDGKDLKESIRDTGYRTEFSSEDEEGVGGSMTIYQADAPNLPQFYIDIMGQNSGIATLVAKDFPALVVTLQQLHPLLTLAGLDQFAFDQVRKRIDREDRERAKAGR